MFNLLIQNIISNQNSGNGTTYSPDGNEPWDPGWWDDFWNNNCHIWCQPGMSTQDVHTTADYH